MCQNYQNSSKKQKKHQKWTKTEKENFLWKKISSEKILFFSEIFLFLQRFFSFSLDFCLFPIFLQKSTEMKSTSNMAQPLIPQAKMLNPFEAVLMTRHVTVLHSLTNFRLFQGEIFLESLTHIPETKKRKLLDSLFFLLLSKSSYWMQQRRSKKLNHITESVQISSW